MKFILALLLILSPSAIWARTLNTMATRLTTTIALVCVPFFSYAQELTDKLVISGGAELKSRTFMSIHGSENNNCPGCIDFFQKGVLVARMSPNGRFQIWDKRGLRVALRNVRRYADSFRDFANTIERGNE